MSEKSEARLELEARAKELGVKFAANIGNETLAERVQEAADTAQDNEKPGTAELKSLEGQAGAADAAVPVGPASDLVVRVIGPKEGFRRAGRSFGPEPVDIPLEELSEAEKQALISEPRLIVATVAADGSTE